MRARSIPAPVHYPKMLRQAEGGVSGRRQRDLPVVRRGRLSAPAATRALPAKAGASLLWFEPRRLHRNGASFLTNERTAPGGKDQFSKVDLKDERSQPVASTQTPAGLSLEGDDVGLDTRDQVAVESEYGHPGELESVPTPEPALPEVRSDDGFSFLDQALHGQLRAPLEGVVLDLAVKRLLALRAPMAVDHPDDVLAEQGQDRLVVARAEPVEVGADGLLA